jgi:hypothetical protein
MGSAETGRRSPRARWAALLPLLLTVLATPSWALVGATLRDLADPVPPGGTLAYRIRLSNLGLGTPVCFNPPPECVVSAAFCNNPAPVCIGDSFIGFVCDNAANQGADCGVGDPPVPNPALCIAHTQGQCQGGTNSGFACTGNADCPGTSVVCVRAYNEGTNCGVGNPPTPVPGFCLANPAGICSGGPNFGFPCTAPHGTITAECPPDPTGPVGVAVTMAVPANTTFLDADGGGTTDGTTVTWLLPPLDACGVAGTPQCPAVVARFTVDAFAPLGTVIEAKATATDGAGSQDSTVQKTTVGTFGLRALTLAYPLAANRDRVLFRTVFSIAPGATVDPATELLRIQVANPLGGVVDLGLPAGQLLGSSSGFGFKSRDPGINNLTLRELYPGFFSLVMKASRLNLPDVLNVNNTLTITLGDDELTTDLTLISKRQGRRFILDK